MYAMRVVLVLLATASLPACTSSSVVYADSKCDEAKINLTASYFGSTKYDIASIQDVVRTTLTRYESSIFNNTARCDMQLDVLGSCLDELEMEVFAGSYVQIKPVVQAAVSASPQCNVTLCQGASGMLQPGDKAISGTFMVRGSDQVGSFFTLKPMQDEDEQHMLALLSLPLFGGASDEGDDCKVVYEADSDVALHAAFMGMGFVSQSAG